MDCRGRRRSEQGRPYLLAFLGLLHLAPEGGDLHQLDGILVVRVCAQEVHLVLDLPVLCIQMSHLLLQAWKRGREDRNRICPQDFPPRRVPE